MVLIYEASSFFFKTIQNAWMIAGSQNMQQRAMLMRREHPHPSTYATAMGGKSSAQIRATRLFSSESPPLPWPLPILNYDDFGRPGNNIQSALIHSNNTSKTAFRGTLDLSEFNVDVMTRNNGAHQRSPYGPGIQKWPFFLFHTPNFFSLEWNCHFQAIYHE